MTQEIAPTASGDYALRMLGVSKVYGTTEVLGGVDFDVRPGEIHALAGSNGAGKSTLMKIARGVVEPTKGEVHIGPTRLMYAGPEEAKRAGLAMVFQELSLAPTLSALDNIFLNDERTTRGLVDVKAERSEAEELLARLGVSLDLTGPVAALGVAEQQMVEIAKALRLARVGLLLDEPTGALSRREIERLFDVLRQVKSLGVGIVFVTHHLGEIFEIADRVTALRDGSVVLSARIDEVTLADVIHAMIGQHVTEVVPSGRPSQAGSEPMLLVQDLAVTGKLHDVSFELYPGEVVGIAGLAGSGRTVLLKALFGAIPRTRGRVTLGGSAFDPPGPASAIDHRVYLIPENRRTEGLVLEHSVAENLVLSLLSHLTRRIFFFDGRRARSIATDWVANLAIKVPAIDAPAGQLSGGNQQKVVLGKALATNSRLLLLDEPTFGIDVQTAVDIRTRVREFVEQARAAIWVSSDLRELIEVSDRILVLADGSIKQQIANRPRPVSEAQLLGAIQRSSSGIERGNG